MREMSNDLRKKNFFDTLPPVAFQTRFSYYQIWQDIEIVEKSNKEGRNTMKICAYCGELKVEEHSEIRPDAKKKLLFPDGQRLSFYQICFACNHVRLDWQKKIDAEKIRLADFRRQWHLDVAERNAKKRAEIDARNAEREKKRAELEAEREASREKREAAERAQALARMAKLEAELDALRKKYSPSDDKNT